MGYIQIPKLVGGGDEPVITARDMPNDWKYYTSLKENDKDEAYLLFKGNANEFYIGDLIYNASTIDYATLYGGTNGTTPLYRCFYNRNINPYWAHYENGSWVANTNQPEDFFDFRLKDADLDNYPKPFTLKLSDLTGKAVTNDPHLGNTELFTFIVHGSSGNFAKARIVTGSADGGTTSNSVPNQPIVAYSGGAYGLKALEYATILDLEFVEILGDTELKDNCLTNTYWLGKVNIPNTVTTTGNYMFSGSTGLQECTLPTGMTNIGEGVFNNCYNLKKVKIQSNIQSIGTNAFTNTSNLKSLNIPSTVESLGASCFASSGIENITFPSSLTSMGSYCFQGSQIKEAILPNTLTTIYDALFSACKQLKTTSVPGSISNLTSAMFSGCTSLENVTLGSGIQTIGANCFDGDYSLKKINIPSTVTSIGGNAFRYCASLKEIQIPNGCTLGTYCFNNCSNLENITLPNDLTAIPNYCFQYCRNMVNYELPSTIQTIGTAAFQYNYSLEKLVIPATVTNIAANAFSTCGACRYFKMLGPNPTLANASAFGTGNTYVKILIPYDYISNYWSATNWSSTTNNIKRKLRGYKTFQQGDTLPTKDSTNARTLTWYEHLEDLLVTTATGTPTATPITTAPYDGEFYCTIA